MTTAYAYSRIPAFNPNTSPVSVARSATGSVYDIGDTGFTTPLNLTLVATNTVTTTLISDANAMFPDFTLVDRTQCVFKSGSQVFVLTTTTPIAGPQGAASTVAGPPGPATTDASLLAAGTVADARLPTRLQDTALNATYAPVSGSANYAKPLGLSAVALGDSQTAQGGVGGASDRGWFVWMNGLLGQPWASFRNAGVNGDTLAQMLARVQTDVIAYSPDIVFVFGGKNTISTGATFASIQTTYTQILDALRTAGINRVVVVTDPPHNGRSAAERAVRDQLNDWLRRLPQTRPQVIATIDAYSAVVDPATGDYAAGMAYDLLHPSTAGAQAIGRVAANVMAPLLPKVNTLPTGVDSLNLLGIAGSFIGARTTGIATGLSPDWSEYHAGADSTFVKVPRTDGVQGEWQQVTTAAAQHTQQIFKDITTGFAVGDTLRGSTEYQVDTVGEAISGGYPNWAFQIGFLDGAGNAIPAPPYPVQALTSSDGRKTPPAGTFIARTPDFVVPAGTVKLRVQFLDYAAATTIRHGRTVIRKVV